MDSKHWQEQFKDELRSFVSTFQKVDGGRGMLASAIEKQVVPEEVYLNWARDTSMLPLLRLAYFSEQTINKTLWKKWEKAFAWDQDCLPFAEWDGHVFVACLERPQFPPDFPGIPVLCPMAGLDKIWETYQAADVVVPLIELANKPDEHVEPEREPREASLINFELQDERIGETSPEEGEAPESPMEQENPEGFVFEPQRAVKLEKIELKASVPITNLTPTASPVSTPAAVTATPTAPLTPTAAVIPPLSVKNTPAKEVAKAEAPKKPVTLVSSTVQKPITVSGVKTIPAPPPPVAPTLPQAVKARPTERSAVNGHESYFLEMLSKEKPSIFQNACNDLFKGMKEHFKNTLILSIDSKMQFAKPIAWDQGIDDNKQAALVNLKTPSIFRIAYSTQKPFHGPISLNEVNEKFFEDWNHNAIPGHVTLVPIMNGDRAIGIVLGIGEPTAYTRTALQATEKNTLDFIHKLVPMKAQSA